MDQNSTNLEYSFYTAFGVPLGCHVQQGILQTQMERPCHMQSCHKYTQNKMGTKHPESHIT